MPFRGHKQKYTETFCKVQDKHNYEKSLFLSDLHIPFEDNNAIKIVKNFASCFKPEYIFLAGDIIDFYTISTFDKDPERINNLQSDIDKTYQFLLELRSILPKSEIVYLEGNHENRLTRYLWKHPEIANLRALTIENLLQLDSLNIKYKTIRDTVLFHKFLVEHGDIVRKHSGYTARGQMEKRGISGISGHTHRLGTHFHTDMSGDHVWVENGCLCDRNPEYVSGLPDWQQGWSVGYYKNDGERFSIEQVCITQEKAVYAGLEFF